MERNSYMYDKNGLLPTVHLSVRLGRFYLGNEELFIAPECRGVVEYLRKDEKLWSAARLRFNHVDIRQKRAPIIGVPFGRALRQAYESSSGLQKSMFCEQEWTKYRGKAVIATMVAHTMATASNVEFQAWQFLDVSNETFYVHAIIDKASTTVTHLDGATMQHTELQRAEIAAKACKIKGTCYTKHFRLDGHFSMIVTEAIMDQYFPVQSLTQEFLEAMN